MYTLVLPGRRVDAKITIANAMQDRFRRKQRETSWERPLRIMLCVTQHVASGAGKNKW